MTPIELKSNFEKASSFITREGITNLINWITEETDFFTAPASTNFHSNFNAGLLEHSLLVVRFALHNFNLIQKYKPELEYLRESVVLCALFHDISKINQYKIIEKWTKDENNKWLKYIGYTVKDPLPLAHGFKSVYYISKFIKLTDAETLAISWHMGKTDCVQPESISKYAYDQALDHPLVKLIIAADILATSIEETIDYKLQAK